MACYLEAAAEQRELKGLPKISAKIEFRTTLGAVRDIGTQFEVRLSEPEKAGEDQSPRVSVQPT